MFYQSVVANVIFFAAVCWRGSIRGDGANNLNRLVRKDSSVVGIELGSVDVVTERRRKAEGHHGQSLSSLYAELQRSWGGLQRSWGAPSSHLPSDCTTGPTSPSTAVHRSALPSTTQHHQLQTQFAHGSRIITLTLHVQLSIYTYVIYLSIYKIQEHCTLHTLYTVSRFNIIPSIFLISGISVFIYLYTVLISVQMST